MRKILSASVQLTWRIQIGRGNREAGREVPAARVVRESLPEEVTLELRPESGKGARNSKGSGEGKGESPGLGK